MDQQPQWAPPTTEPVASDPPRRGWVGYLLVLGLVAAIVGLWALGGFKEHVRIDYLDRGDNVDLGPATVSVQRVLAKKNYSEGWDVRAYGTCSTHEGSNLDMNRTATEDELFAIAGDVPARPVAENALLYLDPKPGQFIGRDHLAPGLPPMPCAFQASFADGFDPTKGVLVQFVNLEFRDTSVTQDQDPVWTGGTNYYRYRLPVEVVESW